MVAFRGDKALLSTLAARTVMDLSAESADLRGRVDSMSLTIVCILVQDDNGGSTMCLNETSSSYQG